jgi:SAM-dependent methyltransferase
MHPTDTRTSGTDDLASGTDAAIRRRWNRHEGRFWAAEAARFDRMLGGYGAELVAAATLQPGEHVLDVGCGAGATTLDAAWSVGPRGHALGLDLSRPLLDVARARARELGVDNVAFVEADAQLHPFAPLAFDAVASRFGAMLFADPEAAFANLARALRPAGRLVLVTWAERAANAWVTVPEAAVAAHIGSADDAEDVAELPAPSDVSGVADARPAPGAFSLADPRRIEALLCSAGFSDVRVCRRRHDVWVGSDVTDALGFFERSLGPARANLPDALFSAVGRTLRASLLAYARDDGIWLPSAAWLTTARRAT